MSTPNRAAGRHSFKLLAAAGVTGRFENELRQLDSDGHRRHAGVTATPYESYSTLNLNSD